MTARPLFVLVLLSGVGAAIGLFRRHPGHTPQVLRRDEGGTRVDARLPLMGSAG